MQYSAAGFMPSIANGGSGRKKFHLPFLLKVIAILQAVPPAGVQ